jgi:hypothetical protein
MTLFMCAFPGLASAAGAQLEVQVLDESTGEPLAGVGVCLGTGAEIDQLGALSTDVSGRAVFKEIPGSALHLTLSKQGYVAEQRALEPFYQSGVLVLKLGSGWLAGPRCRVPNRADAISSGRLLIGSLAATPVPGRPGHVRVGIQSQGGADQVRISERADFRDARWQSYAPELHFELDPASEEKELFVQLMRSTNRDGASIQILSPVRGISVASP